MKTKIILRAFFAAIFVLGAMAINAQKVYVVKKNGTVDEHHMHYLDRFNFTAPTDGNLLKNPSLEMPYYNGNDNDMPAYWQTVEADWFNAYYNGVDLTPFGSATAGTHGRTGNPASNRRASGNFFTVTTQNGYSVSEILTGTFSGRLPGAETGGTYQIITDLEPGDYEFGCDIAMKEVQNGQKIKDYETVKILSPDGLFKYGEVLIPSAPQDEVEDTSPARYQIVKLELNGVVTIDPGVDSVRFQIDQFNGDRSSAPATILTGSSFSSPLIVFDNCFFRKVVAP